MKKKIREEIYHMDPPKNYLHAPKAVFDPLYQVMKVALRIRVIWRNLTLTKHLINIREDPPAVVFLIHYKVTKR